MRSVVLSISYIMSIHSQYELEKNLAAILSSFRKNHSTVDQMSCTTYFSFLEIGMSLSLVRDINARMTNIFKYLL